MFDHGALRFSRWRLALFLFKSFIMAAEWIDNSLFVDRASEEN